MELFSSLPNLMRLNLNENNIDFIDVDAFSSLDQLTWLHLQKNEIADIKVGAFSNLGLLKRLLLDSNQLTRLRVGVFSGLHDLQTLSLSQNRLTWIDGRSFQLLPKLSYLIVSGNNISCNCRIFSTFAFKKIRKTHIDCFSPTTLLTTTREKFSSMLSNFTSHLTASFRSKLLPDKVTIVPILHQKDSYYQPQVFDVKSCMPGCAIPTVIRAVNKPCTGNYHIRYNYSSVKKACRSRSVASCWYEQRGEVCLSLSIQQYPPKCTPTECRPSPPIDTLCANMSAVEDYSIDTRGFRSIGVIVRMRAPKSWIIFMSGLIVMVRHSGL